jgi:hypothetical protein
MASLLLILTRGTGLNLPDAAKRLCVAHILVLLGAGLIA